ncbi:MAG TPA: ABC transporter permease [Candidatus Sulfotelmatobacter sp.]|nr:ABC transporter permease [Candidatus Sulfotelmatobacter sp.]
MGTLGHDIRFAIRMILRNPAFSTIAALSLALGIGANTTIFTVVNAILLNPLPVKEISSLVQMDTVDSKTMVTQANATKMGMSYPNFQDYARLNQVFTGLTCLGGGPLTWSGGAEPKQLAGVLVSANYFDVLGVQPSAGRFFFPDEDKQPGGNNVVVLSYSLWSDKFGADRNVVGKSITLNATPYTVIGVAPRGFKGTFTFGPAELVWIPASMYGQTLSGFIKDNFNNRRFLDLVVYGRLRPGVSLSQAEASLKAIAQHLESEFPKDNRGRSVALTPLADAAIGANNYKQVNLAGGLMMGIVGLVLLIACANLANLLLAQAAHREREIGLRAALGASRGRLLRQMLTESLVLSLLAGILGLAIAYGGRTVLWSLRPPFIASNDLDLSLDWHVLLFTLSISVLTAVLIAVAPAIKSARPNLAEVLNVGGRGGTMSWRRSPLRSLLVVSEIALALVALIGAGLFIRSMQNAQRIDLGFESEKLFMMAFDLGALHYEEGQGQQFYRAAVERAKATPGVEAATVASNFPLGGGLERTVFPEGQDETSGYRGTLTELDDVTPSYFETLRIPLVRGRLFDDGDRKNTAKVAVINEAMVKQFWPNEEAVGKRFHFFGEPDLREVVGVVKNTVVNAIGEEPQPLAYLPITQDYSPAATLQVRTSGRPGGVIGGARVQIQSLEPNMAITNVQTVQEIVSQGLWGPRMGAGLLTVFGGLALILAAVGVYGVLSYSVSQQTREIGIRMSLGAQQNQVLRLVIGQGIRLAVAGLALGLLVAFALTRVLSSLLFGVSTHDPVTFGGVSLVLVSVAILACYIPARRATRVEPIIALRYE